METTTRSATSPQLSWLRGEVEAWQRAGILDPDQASRALSLYRVEPHRGLRVSMGRVLLSLGGAFVGVGLIWLVAANLDQLSPAVRFVGVAVLWLVLLIGGELLADRRTSVPVVGAVRLMAALAFGALVFQAAQSLQVPAYEPRLLGVWAAGALVHAYVASATAPFVVGLAAGTFWWIAQPMWVDASGLGVVVTLGAGAVAAASAAVLHDRFDGEAARDFAWFWRLLGAGLALATLFAAAVPGVGGDGVDWSTWLVVEVAVAALAVLAAVAATVAHRSLWLEPVATLVVLGVSVLLASWDTGTDTSDVDAADWAHAALSVAAYVLLAIAVVALSTLRDHPPLGWLAMGALVVFTTFQSFAVFAPIVTGAWLFVVLGVVFLGTGYLFDRARRGLHRALETDQEGAAR